MRVSDAFPSKYLKAGEDIPEDEQRILTIADVRMERIGQGSDASDKIVISFNEVEKEFVCNKTNATTLSKLFGDDTDGWVTKRIILYTTYVQFQADMVLALRVRPKVPPAPKAGAKPAPVQATPTEPPDVYSDDVPY